MKIGTPTRAPKESRSAFEPPVVIDDLGCARAVTDAPTTDAGWLALTGGGEKRGLLAARLVATRDRAEQAMHQTAHALVKIRERRESDPGPLPTSWVERLAELHVGELEALWSLDDACHRAALEEPEWVAVPRGSRPISPAETSWSRISRLVGRRIQMTAGMELDDDQFDRLCMLDAARECADDDKERVKENSREALRWAVRTKYGGEAT